MMDQLGRWYPDYPGQQPTQDPAYLRAMQVQQQNQLQQVQAQQQQMAQPQQIQNRAQAGIIPVQSEQQARNWYVGAGQSVTFIDENAPYCYTKTMGFSQLDRPQFTRYRLVREDDAPQQTVSEPIQPAQQSAVHEKVQQATASGFATKEELDAVAGLVASVRGDLDSVKGDIETIRGDLYGIAWKKKSVKKQEETDDA